MLKNLGAFHRPNTNARVKKNSDRLGVSSWTSISSASVAAAAAMFILLLPSYASALSSSYEIDRGFVRLEFGASDDRNGRGNRNRHRGSGQGRSLSITLKVDGGRFTYDASANTINDFSIEVYGYTLKFAEPVLVADYGSVWAFNERYVALKLIGLDFPESNLPENVAGYVETVSVLVAGRWVGPGKPVDPKPGSAVPEPAGALLFGAGLFVVHHRIRRRE